MEAVKAIDCKSVATLIVLRLFILVNYRLLSMKAIDCKSVATLIVLRLFILVNYRLLLWYN